MRNGASQSADGAVVLCDVASTRVEGLRADLAEFGKGGGRKKQAASVFCVKKGAGRWLGRAYHLR